jgi:restriction system protein
MLPWWIGVAIAIVGYFGFRSIASSQAPPGDVTGAVVRGLAVAGQYIVPLIGLVGAIASVVRRKQRAELVGSVTQSASHDARNSMSWREFEVLVGEGFRRQGFQVLENGGGGPDGGVDLMLSRQGTNGSEKFLVQCKQWRAFRVGVDVVRELYGVMAARGAAGGFVVTSGRFTDEAVKFAQGRNVQLVDGPKLHRLIRQGTVEPQDADANAIVQKAPPSTDAAPSCPTCGAQMVRRLAKQGSRAGGEFWGCTRFPACRGTRPIA